MQAESGVRASARPKGVGTGAEVGATDVNRAVGGLPQKQKN